MIRESFIYFGGKGRRVIKPLCDLVIKESFMDLLLVHDLSTTGNGIASDFRSEDSQCGGTREARFNARFTGPC